MSIRMHHFLRISVAAIIQLGAFVVFFIFIFHEKTVVGFIIAAIVFCLGGYSHHFFEKHVSAECPKCYRPAWAMKSPEGRLCFECSKYGYIHETGFSESVSDD